MDSIQSSATTHGQYGPGSYGNKGLLRIRLAIVLLEPHHQFIFSFIFWTLAGGVLTLCRDAVRVFYSPSRQGLKKRFEFRDRFLDCLNN